MIEVIEIEAVLNKRRMNPRQVRETLERDGIALLGKTVPDDALGRMQRCYGRALEFPTWNTWTGYEQNEKWRRLVDHVLLYDRAFVDLAVDPAIGEVLARYIGTGHCLVEARGWETVATRRDFHGWHADAWYAPGTVPTPKEVKLGCYLTDVSSGHFQYIKGSHHADEPARHWPDREVESMRDRIVDAKGPAGTCFLFDTSGVHRQSVPVLERRWVVMYNYHDPDVPLGNFATGYGRYSPLLLSAALIGDLTAEQQRVLGFGRSSPRPDFTPDERRYPRLHAMIKSASNLRMELQDWVAQYHRVRDGVARRLGRRR